MKTGLYSIYDTKAKHYHPPFIAMNEEVATRTIANTFKDQRSQTTEYVMNPDDFQLIKIGDMDDYTGVVTEDYKHIINFSSFKETE